MPQLSIMFVAEEIKQKLLRKLREFIFVSPFTLDLGLERVRKLGLYPICNVYSNQSTLKYHISI